MRLLNISSSHFAGLPDGTYAFTANQTPAEATCVSGHAACGKTSLLRSIGAIQEYCAPSGAPLSTAQWLRRGESEGRVSASFVLSAQEKESLGDVASLDLVTLEGRVLSIDLALSLEPATQPDLGGLRGLFAGADIAAPIAYLPATRRFFERLGRATPAPLLQLPEDEGHFDDHLTWLLDREVNDGHAAINGLATSGLLTTDDRPDSLLHLREGLAGLMPELRLLRVVRRQLQPPLLTFARRDGRTLELRHLSTSEQDAFLVGCTIWRHARGGGSIVLVDDNCGGGATIRALNKLGELAGGVQLIVTAQSEALQSGIHNIKLQSEQAR